MKVTPKLIGDFVALGPEVDFNNKKIRPEVKVAIAAGHIKELKESNGMYNVIFVIEGAKYDMSGYIGVQEPAAKIMEKAFEEKIAVVLRFEKKRKKKVAADLPIEPLCATLDIARENIIKTTVGIFDYNSKSWVLSREALSNPEEDDSSIMNSIESAAVDVEGFFNSAPVPGAAPIVNSNKEEESRENALMSMYFFVNEQINEKGLTLDNPKRRELAINLLKVANLLQMRMFNLEAPVYSAYSHTRARFLVFKWAEVMIPLTQEHVDNIGPWGANLIKTGQSLWSWCREESKNMI